MHIPYLGVCHLRSLNASEIIIESLFAIILYSIFVRYTLCPRSFARAVGAKPRKGKRNGCYPEKRNHNNLKGEKAVFGFCGAGFSFFSKNRDSIWCVFFYSSLCPSDVVILFRLFSPLSSPISLATTIHFRETKNYHGLSLMWNHKKSWKSLGGQQTRKR